MSGMNCIPRRDGRYSGLDHFGIEVDDLEETIARIKKFDPSLSAVKRPPIRPFAAYSAHDPDTNIFDLSGPSMDKKDVYAENNWSADAADLAHRAADAACGAVRAVLCRGVRADAAEPAKDDNCYLSDGRMILMIIPWKITRLLCAGPGADGVGPYRVRGGVGRAGEEGHGVPDRREPAHARPAAGVWVGG